MPPQPAQVKVLSEVAFLNQLERGAENTRRPRDWRMVAPNEVKQGREFEFGCLRYEDESAGIRFSRYRKICRSNRLAGDLHPVSAILANDTNGAKF